MYKTLKIALAYGLTLEKMHSIIEFNQKVQFIVDALDRHENKIEKKGQRIILCLERLYEVMRETSDKLN